MSKFTRLLFRTRIAGICILSIILLLTIFLPPLTQYSEPTIERITIPEHSGELVLYEDLIYSLAIFYNDTWHNAPISNATVSAISSDPNIVEVAWTDADSETAGLYLVTILAKSHGGTSLTININKPNYEPQSVTLTAFVYSSPPPPPGPMESIIYGAPSILVIIIGFLIYKVQNRKVTDAEMNYPPKDEKSDSKNGAPGGI